MILKKKMFNIEFLSHIFAKIQVITPHLMSLWRQIFREYKILIYIVLICIIISNAATISIIVFIQQLVDCFILPIVNSENIDYDLKNTLIVLSAFLSLGTLTMYITTRLLIHISQGVILSLRNKLFNHILRLPMNYFSNNSKGKIMNYFTSDIETVQTLIGNCFPTLFSSSILLILTFIAMVRIGILFTVITLLCMFLSVLISRYYSYTSREFYLQRQENLSILNGYVEEMISGLDEVKIFNYEASILDKFTKINKNLCYTTNKFLLNSGILSPINNFISNFAYVCIVTVGAYFILKEPTYGITLGGIVTYVTLSKNFTKNLSSITQQISFILSADVSIKRIIDVLDIPQENENDLVTLNVPIKSLEFKNVFFNYNESTPILQNMNWHVTQGQKIAIMGNTGVGKTTIINLLLRFYDIKIGEILIDGYHINLINRKSLRQNFGVVFQKPFFFEGTIMDNLRYGHSEATKEECIIAAKEIGADHFISMLPKNYQTVISEDGNTLSQGELQLLSLTRTMVANPSFLILDEPTSTLDYLYEDKVKVGINKLMEGRTTIIISHRLSVIEDADSIFILKDGTIVEQGTHQQLLDLKGLYYYMHNQ